MRAVQPLPILIAANLATGGCAGTGSAPDTGVEPERAPAPVVRETPRPATTTPVRASFEYAAGTVSYLVTSDATISEIDSAAGSPRTFREVARVELAVAPAGNQTLVTTKGLVESATGTTMIQSAVDTLRAESMDAVAEPRMPICGRDTVPPVHLGSLLPPVPRELREGLRWQRRQIYASCQGAIPIRVERTDSYVVTGRSRETTVNGVTLTRNSTLTYKGSGVEGQHNVRLAGSGSGQATFILDPTAGRVQSAMEQTDSEIDITTSGRTRRFSQRVTRAVSFARN